MKIEIGSSVAFMLTEIAKGNSDYAAGDYLGIGPRVQDPKDPGKYSVVY